MSWCFFEFINSIQLLFAYHKYFLFCNNCLWFFTDRLFLWFLQAEILLSTAESPTTAVAAQKFSDLHKQPIITSLSLGLCSRETSHPTGWTFLRILSLSLKWKHSPWPLSLSVPMPDLLSSYFIVQPTVLSLDTLEGTLLPGAVLCKLVSTSASPSRFLSVTETRWKYEVPLWPDLVQGLALWHRCVLSS